MIHLLRRKMLQLGFVTMQNHRRVCTQVPMVYIHWILLVIIKVAPLLVIDLFKRSIMRTPGIIPIPRRPSSLKYSRDPSTHAVAIIPRLIRGQLRLPILYGHLRRIDIQAGNCVARTWPTTSDIQVRRRSRSHK